MSHTGKVHEGDEMSTNGVQRVLVVTEGFSAGRNGSSIIYHISQRPRLEDLEMPKLTNEEKIPPGTPVTFTPDIDGKNISKIVELDKSHFLYDTIANNKIREMIWIEVHKLIFKY